MLPTGGKFAIPAKLAFARPCDVVDLLLQLAPGIHPALDDLDTIDVSAVGIAYQPALALQIPGDEVSDGMRQLGEILTGWRLDPAKPCTRSMGGEKWK